MVIMIVLSVASVITLFGSMYHPLPMILSYLSGLCKHHHINFPTLNALSSKLLYTFLCFKQAEDDI